MGADPPHQFRARPLAPVTLEHRFGAHRTPARRLVATLRERAGLYWTLQLAGWTAFALVSFLALLPTFPAAVVPRLAATKLTRAAWGLATSDVLRRLYRRLGVSRLPGATALAIAALSIVALGMAWYAVFLATARVWAPAGSPGLVWSALPHASWDSVVVLGAWSAAYFGIRAWQQADASARQASAATARADRAQLDTLRYQLNPHFLFNALSSIRALIAEDQTRARNMVTSFADMLRRSLDDSAVAEVPLRDEIAAVEQYLAIERVRFEHALDVAVEVAPAANASLVPTFLLHPLVENAIAHGTRTGNDPLRIRIHADATPTGLRIEVANSGSLADGPGAPTRRALDAEPGAPPRRAVGVASVRERLAILYPGHHRFGLAQDGAWVRATIEIDRPTPGIAG
jgi:two-component system, LytTR family, sensor kinase